MFYIFGQKFKCCIGKYGILFMGILYGNEEFYCQWIKYGQMDFEIKVDFENFEYIVVCGDKGWFVVKNMVGIDSIMLFYEWIMVCMYFCQQCVIEVEVGFEVMFCVINCFCEIGKVVVFCVNFMFWYLIV